MSSIKTTELQGDVSVGRHITAGGNADVNGNVTVHKNMKVEGWLDAKNIKGPNKGIFLDAAKLREAYPLPHEGWWALVGNSLPAALYVADGGEWVPTGETAGNPTIDSQQYNEAVAQLDADVKAVAADVQKNATSIGALQTYINTIGTSVNANSTDITSLKTRMSAAEGRLSTAGMPNGLAQLDDSGHVPASQLPSFVDDVLEYESADAFPEEGETGKIYVAMDTNKTYRWGGTVYVAVADSIALGYTPDTAYPGNEGAELASKAEDTSVRLEELMSEYHGDAMATLNRLNALERKMDSKVGNTYNLTVEIPLPTGEYYSDIKAAEQEHSVLEAVMGAGVASLGLQITFAIGVNSWKTYQYTGVNTTEAQVMNPDNWIDLAGMSAGDESVVNVNALCGDKDYTLSTAVSAIMDYEEETSITYRKEGLVISYRRDALSNTWETKQYIGKMPDMTPTNEKQWVDFGGGGGGVTVETKDDVEAGGTDALSTGGAYNIVPATLKVDTETEGVIKMQMVNAGGDAVGDEVQFPVGTGSGEGSGTLVAVQFKHSPMYTKAGGEVLLEASIRSVQSTGQGEVLNNIEYLELIDRDTAQVLQTLMVNKASSASVESYDFTIDVSPYFTTAGQRRFRLVAHDDGGHEGSRNLNVTAVDVTISSVQTLNYTTNTVVNAGGAVKTLQMYKFANNASDKGILVTTEIFYQGSWRVLGEATILDTYSHSVSVNPTDVLGGGEALSHGAYELRIHGEDIGSRENGIVGTGVRGNYLHTTLMCVGEDDTAPIVATRWTTEGEEGEKKLYSTIEVEFAVFDPKRSDPVAEVLVCEKQEAERVAYRNQSYVYTQKVVDVSYDGSVTLDVVVKSGTSASPCAPFHVVGTLLEVEEVKTQRQFSIDLSGRSNNESDKSISDSGVALEVSGMNWSTNGFVADTFGTSERGGTVALRIAENATGVLHYAPFGDASIEQNGAAMQFTVMKKNVADRRAVLMESVDGGMGMWIDGSGVVLTFDGEKSKEHTIRAALQDGVKTNVAIVIEPSETAPYPGIGVAKMYFDGEEAGACFYNAGSLVAHDREVTFDSREGDLYLYNIKAWRTYFGFEQEFHNYLLTLTDTDAMIREYDDNDVMASVTAENTTKNRPQASALYAKGMPYFVVCKNKDTADNEAKDNYPEYLEGLDGDKKTKRTLDVYYYNPQRPWQEFKAIGASVTNQGTTSSKRPIKNIKMKLKGAAITLLHKAEEFSGEDLEKFKECEANAANHRVQVLDNSLPTNIITVKVDYSESGGANNGASTNLYNDLQRELGADYVTPAQLAYNGKHKYVINTSIASHPVAFFRTDRYSPDATSPSYGYFHAKGNWNEDKGDAKVFGFEGVEGYNKECLNYGEFYELVAGKGETIEAFASRQDKSQWVFYSDEEKTETFDVVVLSEFCGPQHKIYRKQSDGTWNETTGSMRYDGSKWLVEGDVVNPVENYELLKYDALDWFQGVNTVEDMLAPDTEGKPIWLQYFESRYPDNDALNEMYEAGKKVPYQLYRWLRFCQDCNHHLDEADGNITLGGQSVAGTKANRLKKWQQELHTIANVRSVCCYHVFTDYLNCVDQRSKNMMVGFYLDMDGVVRMYLNHLYDGDTLLESDNDCGLTIDALLDPNNDTDGVFQGHDSVLFVQNAAVGNNGFWLNADGSKTITMRQVAGAMRELTTKEGLRPFSLDGLVKYWITDRLSKWPKVVSSFDGERKYIEHSKSTANYFYALHGLGVQRLKNYIKTRFAYRDGFYQTGDMFANPVTMRVTGRDVTVRIRAAKDGYFGIGVDRYTVATDSCYLHEGEEYTLKSGMTNTGSGTMLAIFGAERLEMLDLSDCTPSPASWDISALTLLKELRIGGESYELQNNNEGYLTNLTLGNLPYLEVLDIRNTAVTTVNAKYCPRLREVRANGSPLERIDMAEAGQMERLELPRTYKYLSLRYMPKLTNAAVVMEDAASVETLIIEGSEKIEAFAMLMKCAGASGSALKYVRVSGLKTRGEGEELAMLHELELKGIDATLNVTDEPQITGEYRLTRYTDETLLREWRASLPLLDIKQQPYSAYKEYENTVDSQRVTNMDNGTGWDSESVYVASGHVVKIRQRALAVSGKYDRATQTMRLTRLSSDDLKKKADGSAFDPTDPENEGYDVFLLLPRFWYKGINDFKNQEKYTLLSSSKEMPEPSYEKITVRKLSECLHRDGAGVDLTWCAEGEALSSTAIGELASCAVYKIDVEGMRQVRYIGLNSAIYGSVFVDAGNVVLRSDKLQISAIAGSPLDFKNENGDYIFRDVPGGAKWLYFTCMRGLGDEGNDIIAVDSDDIEAMEPGWELHDYELIGIYGGSVDGFGMWRSLSGKKTRCGTGTSKTSNEWSYDSEGNPVNMPMGALNYTYQDMLNLCAYRGKGYHSISYEQSKTMAVLSRCYSGNLDDQRVYGFGCGWQYTTGSQDSLGLGDTKWASAAGQANKVWGLEGFIACNYEVMDLVAVNVKSFAGWKAKGRPDNDTTDPTDAKWHIHDLKSGEERVVQGLNNTTSYSIARVKHGRKCDTIASALTSDRSQYSTCYAAESSYSATRGCCVGRADYSARAGGGLVYAHAYYGSAYSWTGYGSRLAFSGEIENAEELYSDNE